MAKLETLSYVIPVDAIQTQMLKYVKEIDPNALLILADEIKSGALLQACAWLSSGGIWQWRSLQDEHCIKQLYLQIMEMVGGFNVRGNVPTHLAGSHWAISVETWAMANAVFAYGLADNILRNTHGIHETIDRYGDTAIFFAPQRIFAQEKGESFIFQLGLFNRELLPTGG